MRSCTVERPVWYGNATPAGTTWVFLVVLVVFVVASPGSTQETASDLSSFKNFRYAVTKGDQWRDSFERNVVIEGDFSFGRSGRGGGQERKKIRVEFSDTVEMHTRVKRTKSNRFTIATKIIHLQVHVDSPVWQLNYDSKQDRSGLYHRIFGKVLKKDIILEFNRRGQRIDVEGLETILQKAVSELPDTGENGGDLVEAMVSVVSSYLQKEFVLSILSQGWKSLPEGKTFGSRWRRKEVFPFLTMLERNDFVSVRTAAEYVAERGSEDRLRLQMFPEVSVVHWETTDEKQRSEDPGGTVRISQKNGVEKRHLHVSMKGGEEDQAKIKMNFSRTSKE